VSGRHDFLTWICELCLWVYGEEETYGMTLQDQDECSSEMKNTTADHDEPNNLPVDFS